MQKQKTIYHLILDKSGSMSDCIEQTISGFNEQIEKIRKLEKDYPEQELSIGLTTFNDYVVDHFFMRSPESVKKINSEIYRPSGSTALLDAIGLTIKKIEKEIQHYQNECNTTVVFVILTDGYENASKLFKLEDIRSAIQRLEGTEKWTFSFIGATLDAVDVAASMSIKRQNSFMFDKSNMTNMVFSNLSASMEEYMLKKREGRSLRDLFSKK